MKHNPEYDAKSWATARTDLEASLKRAVLSADRSTIRTIAYSASHNNTTIGLEIPRGLLLDVDPEFNLLRESLPDLVGDAMRPNMLVAKVQIWKCHSIWTLGLMTHEQGADRIETPPWLSYERGSEQVGTRIGFNHNNSESYLPWVRSDGKVAIFRRAFTPGILTLYTSMLDKIPAHYPEHKLVA